MDEWNEKIKLELLSHVTESLLATIKSKQYGGVWNSVTVVENFTVENKILKRKWYLVSNVTITSKKHCWYNFCY